MGPETFLDLVEGVALMSSAAPILLVCMARPELLTERADWPVSLRLEPLASGGGRRADLRAAVPSCGSESPMPRAATRSSSPRCWRWPARPRSIDVPPTLRALLAARLDQLDAPERAVLERGAVEGELFHRGAVQALAPEETQITPRLAVLTRKDLIRPDQAQLPGDDGFRFRHLLIRDAAYEALPKSTRVELHRRFAEWLAERGADLVELDEILGYHFEQARGYAAELGLVERERRARRPRRCPPARGRGARRRTRRRGRGGQAARTGVEPDPEGRPRAARGARSSWRSRWSTGAS